jgi:chemotaxis response regulator CheB
MKSKCVARDFTVVCVGGSAGGLDAYIRLLRHLPDDTGVASYLFSRPLPAAAFAAYATGLHSVSAALDPSGEI